MTRPLSQRLTRRRLLASAAAIGAGLALGSPPAAHARPGQAKEVLTHDEVQEIAAFGRGRHLGTQVRNGSLEGAGVFESEVIESPFPFTHVGLHWRGNPQATSTRFELRSSEDGVTWTDWHSLHIEALPQDTPAGETYASLYGVRRHRYVQYRGTLSGVASVNRITPTFLNSYDGPVIETEVVAALNVPAVIDVTREGWGCDERLRFTRRNKEIWPRMYVPVKKLVVHHTAGRNDYTEDEAPGEVAAVYTYHAVTLGWGDIGYNVLIDRFGKSYEGRYSRDLSGGREVFGPDVVAGHASAHNYGSCGFSLLGEFEPGYTAPGGDSDRDMQPPGAMIQKLIDLLAYRAAGRFIDPAGVSHFLRSDGAWNDDLPNISGHRDCFNTACPGQLVYDLLPQIRSAVAARLGFQSGPAFLSGPDGGPGVPNQTTGQLSFTWTGPAGAQYRYVLEGWYKASISEAISYLSGFTADRRPDWPTEWSTQTSASFSNLTDGHYTMHLQRQDGAQTSYESSRTVLISGASAGGKKPPRGKANQ